MQEHSQAAAANVESKPISTEIRIVGTSHVSEKSVDEVNAAIEAERPDVVAVELCKGRYDALTGAVPKEISIKDMLKGGRLYLFLVQILLSQLQKKIGMDVGVQPGAEMLSAIEKAHEINARIALVDRDIQVTMQRFWSMMKFREKLKMIWALSTTIAGVGADEIDIDLEEITNEDVVTQLMKELRDFSPGAARVLVDERDAFIAGNILLAARGVRKVVAVIGAGHKEGVQHYISHPGEIPPLEGIAVIHQKRFNPIRVFGIAMLAFVVAVAALLLSSGITMSLLATALLYWVVINGTLSALGAAIARGHPLSIITAFSVAWLTSLNPFMAAGWFAGIVEAWVRNPTTEDFMSLTKVEDTKGLIDNKIFRILLVAALANLGSVIGTFIGGYMVLDVANVSMSGLIGGALSGIGSMLSGMGSML